MSPTVPDRPAAMPAPIAAVGRYRIERELGRGGMGVVYAAIDPDLEREVAIKLLRGSASDDARTRLLREARAMARLSHPNIVTVFEASTAGGRDYIAMELIAGETLADWLRAERRPARAVVDAFVSAGRGLAAAHAAGIVHRDFKPHNVLRAASGRVVVTDFGLAREAGSEPPGAEAPRRPTPLPNVTDPGAVVGTPAYMAPEQWDGGGVSPATDQFAYCVALWEALAGQRPYRGATPEALRSAIDRGPDDLDAVAVPRWARGVLRRGLHPDPAKRWPSMDALLAQLARARRRGSILVTSFAAVAIAASVTAAAVRRHGPAACPPPARAPATIATSAPLLRGDLARWPSVRARACSANEPVRAQQLACLDGVVARTDANARALAALAGSPHADPGAFEIDPAVCFVREPPRIVARETPELVRAITAWLRINASEDHPDPATVGALVQQVQADPCASAIAHVLASHAALEPAARHDEMTSAQRDVLRCGDDRIAADVALIAVTHQLQGASSTSDTPMLLDAAAAAVTRVRQPDLEAELDALRSEIAKRSGETDAAIRDAEAAIAGFTARGRLDREADLGFRLVDLLQTRASAEDLAQIPKLLASWRPPLLAAYGAHDDYVRSIDYALARWDYDHGDIGPASARMRALLASRPNQPAAKVTGHVVDQAGAPVAGAVVTAAPQLAMGSPIDAVMPTDDVGDALRSATTDATGAFAIDGAVANGLVVAQYDSARSPVVPVGTELRLVLAPTCHIDGRVALGGVPAVDAEVRGRAFDQNPAVRYNFSAPIASDGRFQLDGVPCGKDYVTVGITHGDQAMAAATVVDVPKAGLHDVQLAIGLVARTVRVTARSAVQSPLANAQVFLVRGTMPASVTLRDFRTAMRAGAIARFAMPPRVHDEAAHEGDLIAVFTRVPPDPASACVLNQPAMDDYTMAAKIEHNLDRVFLQCAPLASTMTIAVAPFPRLDGP